MLIQINACWLKLSILDLAIVISVSQRLCVKDLDFSIKQGGR